MRLSLAILTVLLSNSAFAEYRAYKLKITDTRSSKSREVLSTLMPEQYIVYYPITSYQTVVIVDHWMCFERSDGFKRPCTRPFDGLEKGQKTGSQSSPNPVLSP